ncbi:hypothetical protein NIES2101_23270 [Calothrix sp. HK-06]|nr:hypothetical protein NIES2101_23270 [Calothrix sp. HK-06]
MSQIQKSKRNRILTIVAAGGIGLIVIGLFERNLLNSLNPEISEDYGYQVAELIANKDINKKNDAGETALHLAVKNNDLRLVEILINSGADVNATTNYKATPLHYAASFAKNSIINLLASKGSNINAVDNNGKKPLDWAIEAKNNDNIELLKALSKQLVTRSR